MAGTSNIFKELQEFVILPPKGLYAKLWKKVKKTDTDNIINVETISSADVLHVPETTAIAEEKIFSLLQSYIDKEAAAPIFNFEKISEAAFENNNKQAAVKRNTGMLISFYRIAAAAVIVGVLLFIYQVTYKKTNAAYTETTTLNSYPHGSQKNEPDTAPLVKNNLTDKEELINKKTATHPLEDFVTGNNYITKSVNANILNNDFIYTLTNFNYTQMNNFLSDVKSDKKISLNRYSYVNISDKMAAFLKQMYSVNKRKKPTWKARRAKTKLYRWKKKDENYFDKKKGKSPLDIIDLSEFIFKD